jgi:DNA-directed RNA polymerase specialized sigma24 family protein
MGRMPEKWAAAYAAYARKIKTFARNSYRAIPGYSQEDVEQELLEVLWWCTFDYHPNNGATFNTFFQTSARNRIASLIRFANTAKRGSGEVQTTSLDIEELRDAIEETFACESVEDAVVRSITVREYVINECGGNAAEVGRAYKAGLIPA